jgi:hypothetical protein
MQKKTLTLKDFDGKVLVSYLKEDDRLQSAIDYRCEGGPKAILEVVKGERIGVVVALGAGVFGWSLCNKKDQLVPVAETSGEIVVISVPGDTFDKAIGLDKALQRAKIAQSLDAENRVSFYKKVPYTLSNLFEQMTERAEIYYANK